MRDRKLVDRAGQPVSVEFLCQDPADERGVLFYKPYLERLGITVSIRTVDSVQYQNRMRSFDFDITTAVWGQSLSPGNEQRDSSARRRRIGPARAMSAASRIPAVDALIERIIFAKDRAELVAACKAMDRVLLWNFYRRPAIRLRLSALCALGPLQPSGAVAQIRRFRFPALWWWDAEKAAKIGKRS